MSTEKLITDGQSLTGAKHDGTPVRTYDDGFGPLWVLITADSGLLGVIRAQTWEDAWGIAEDEFLPEADETVENFRADYNFTEQHFKLVRAEDGSERRAVAEDYPLAPGQFLRWETERVEPPAGEDVWEENAAGPNERDVHGHGIYPRISMGRAWRGSPVQRWSGTASRWRLKRKRFNSLNNKKEP